MSKGTFSTEKKGEAYLVVHANGNVHGRHKTEGEAKVHAQQLDKQYAEARDMASARITPKPTE